MRYTYIALKHLITNKSQGFNFVLNLFFDRTFASFWTVLKSLTEKLASLHMQLVLTWNDLIKDVARYNDEQHKRHKAVSIQGFITITTTTASLQGFYLLYQHFMVVFFKWEHVSISYNRG